MKLVVALLIAWSKADDLYLPLLDAGTRADCTKKFACLRGGAAQFIICTLAIT